MIPNIHFLISILYSAYFVHSTHVSRKRKTPALSRRRINNTGHIQHRKDTLEHRTKRHAFEPVKRDSSSSLDSDMETISSRALKTPKRKGLAFLQDTTNNVMAVQPEAISTMVQDNSQQQTMFQMRSVTYEPFKVLLNGDSSHRCYHLSQFSNILNEKDFSLALNDTFADHAIGFHFRYIFGILSVMLLISNFTSGQIGLRLVGSNNTNVGGKQAYMSLIHMMVPLVNRMTLPVGSLEDIRALMQNNFHVYIMVVIDVAPGYHDVLLPCPPHDQTFLMEMRQPINRIKRLMDNEKFREIEDFGDTMSNDEFIRCICSTISTLRQYDELNEYLEDRGILANFFMYGNMKVIEEIAADCSYNLQSYFADNDLEIALPFVFKEGHYERFVDLLEVRRKITKGNEPSEWDGVVSSFGSFLSFFFDKFVILENIVPLKHFFDFYERFEENHPEVLDTFREELVVDLGCKLQRSPKARKLFDDLVGQPSLLTSTSVCYGFLHMERIGKFKKDALLDFIEHGWAEAIQMGLKGKYKLGGKCLWKMMTGRYPDKCFGEFPCNDDSLTIVCNRFPTKQRREETWAERNAAAFLAKFEHSAIVMELFPKVLWVIISQYAVSWHDIK